MEHLGRFVVEGELGRGAMGVVYKGFHPGLEVPIAIKRAFRPRLLDRRAVPHR